MEYLLTGKIRLEGIFLFSVKGHKTISKSVASRQNRFMVKMISIIVISLA